MTAALRRAGPLKAADDLDAVLGFKESEVAVRRVISLFMFGGYD
ncbi:hypothetical protein AB0425_31265 [Actinosynnema sp. NPDC051121]